MTHTVVALGDHLDSLRQLTPHRGVIDSDEDLEPRGGVRGLVVGVDLTGARSAREVRAELKRQVTRWAEAARRYPGAIHLLIAYQIPRGLDPSRVQGAADGAALRAHAMLERSAARYVDVTLLDVTECDDTTVLADRIMERISGRAGAYSAAALTWADIRGTSIARATMADYY
ncbi:MULTISPECIES: hypothetical protein [Micrococcales]|uniref:Uncharacterized protein n=1 Tax=Microbacterium binotii TaxID=462710 RepID=A0ABN3PDF3_9MICO|nr:MULTISPECIES: hypothetical protein [Microbacterium]MBZ6372479.1 hypothetical protein [Microbacterium hominis]MBD3758722.1 hypothetical protein [Microbacterium sp.]MCG7414414.1 hypothetical protein [Microbacterium aurum]ONI66708.1 hypothetical protein CSIV_00270 [Microbacterium sp. CSI-V]PZU44106.1 MAG: hypothetical protein DI566_12965 [Microbacterium sp.]